MRDFTDRVVVVTGAGHGIGREIALAFAGRGARIALADIDGEAVEEVRQELQGLGATARAYRVDVSMAEEVEAFCEEVYRDMGRVDVLCNNAGIGYGGAFERTGLEDWERVIGVNLRGVVHGCHFFYRRMLGQGGGGHIVNISSGAALGPIPAMVPYCSTKSAVMALSEALRVEGALHGIGVSTVLPGFVSTDIASRALIRTGPGGKTPDALAARADRVLKARDFPPARVAEHVVRAVEKNRAVVCAAPEVLFMDFSRRFSRRLYDAVTVLAARLFFRWLSR